MTNKKYTVYRLGQLLGWCLFLLQGCMDPASTQHALGLDHTKEFKKAIQNLERAIKQKKPKAEIENSKKNFRCLMEGSKLTQIEDMMQYCIVQKYTHVLREFKPILLAIPEIGRGLGTALLFQVIGGMVIYDDKLIGTLLELELSIDTSYRDKDGNNFFHLAASNNSVDCVGFVSVFLKAQNCDIGSLIAEKNNQGKTPLDIAQGECKCYFRTLQVLQIVSNTAQFLAQGMQIIERGCQITYVSRLLVS